MYQAEIVHQLDNLAHGCADGTAISVLTCYLSVLENKLHKKVIQIRLNRWIQTRKLHKLGQSTHHRSHPTQFQEGTSPEHIRQLLRQK
jgi:hypothetical protein